MPARIRLAFASLTCLLVALPAAAQGKPPALRDVMARAAAYVQDYAEALLSVVGTEHYTQWLELRGRPGGTGTRQLVSEFALVRTADDWVGFRDVYEVDGKPVRDRQDRLLQLFAESPATAFAEGRRIADESSRYNIGSVQRNFNMPTMALSFVRAKNQARFKFKKAGEDTVDGMSVWKVAYEEKQTPTFIRTPEGKSRPATGTLWIVPADGRVLRTYLEIAVESKREMSNPKMESSVQPAGTPGTDQEWTDRRMRSAASVSVSYGVDARLGLMVPTEMRESYEGPLGAARTTNVDGQRIVCRATYSDFRRFETSGRVVIPK
jgi:hypothetical protein